MARAGSSKNGPTIGGSGIATFLIKKGIVAAAGVGMRTVGSGTITISGIPGGSKIKKAYLYWAVLNNGTVPGEETGIVDSTTVTGTVIGTGPSPCWSETTTNAYRADVKALVKARPDPNGAYVLSGFVNSGSQNVSPETEGATLVIIWSNVEFPKRVVVLNDGLLVTTVAPEDVTTTFSIAGGYGFTVKAPVSATLTVAGGDGQDALAFTQFNGTTVDPNNWTAGDGLMWDTDAFDVSSLIAAGDTTATATIGNLPTGGDCIAWTTAILEVTGKRRKLEH